MPYNIALMFKATVATFLISDPKKNAAREKVGDIIGVYPIRVFATQEDYDPSVFVPAEGGEVPVIIEGTGYKPAESMSDKLYVVFVKDVPDAVTLNRIRKLTRQDKDYSVERQAGHKLLEEDWDRISSNAEYSNPVETSRANGVVFFECNYLEVKEQRKFHVRASDIPLGARTQLQLNGYLTITYTQAKNYIRNKRADRAMYEAQDL